MEIIVGALVGALSLMLALVWNDAAQRFIQQYFAVDSNDGVKASVIYALIVSVAVVLLLYLIQRRDALLKFA